MAHQPTTEELFLYMEDFDNADIPADEWEDELESAVRQYNRDHGTHHDPYISVKSYKGWRKDQKYPDI